MKLAFLAVGGAAIAAAYLSALALASAEPETPSTATSAPTTPTTAVAYDGWYVGVAGDKGCIPLSEVGQATTPWELANAMQSKGAVVDLHGTDDPDVFTMKVLAPDHLDYAIARSKERCGDALFMGTAISSLQR